MHLGSIMDKTQVQGDSFGGPGTVVQNMQGGLPAAGWLFQGMLVGGTGPTLLKNRQ